MNTSIEETVEGRLLDRHVRALALAVGTTDGQPVEELTPLEQADLAHVLDCEWCLSELADELDNDPSVSLVDALIRPYVRGRLIDVDLIELITLGIEQSGQCQTSLMHEHEAWARAQLTTKGERAAAGLAGQLLDAALTGTDGARELLNDWIGDGTPLGSVDDVLRRAGRVARPQVTALVEQLRDARDGLTRYTATNTARAVLLPYASLMEEHLDLRLRPWPPVHQFTPKAFEHAIAASGGEREPWSLQKEVGEPDARLLIFLVQHAESGPVIVSLMPVEQAHFPYPAVVTLRGAATAASVTVPGLASWTVSEDGSSVEVAAGQGEAIFVVAEPGRWLTAGEREALGELVSGMTVLWGPT